MNGDRDESTREALAVLRVQLSSIERQIESLDRDVRGGYVTQHEFRPVRNLVFGFVAFSILGLLSMVGAAVIWFVRAGVPT